MEVEISSSCSLCKMVIVSGPPLLLLHFSVLGVTTHPTRGEDIHPLYLLRDTIFGLLVTNIVPSESQEDGHQA